MVRHKCYDEYGNKVGDFDLDLATCEAVIIEHEGRFYQPKFYDLNASPNIATCIPVKVVHCKNGVKKDGVLSGKE